MSRRGRVIPIKFIQYRRSPIPIHIAIIGIKWPPVANTHKSSMCRQLASSPTHISLVSLANIHKKRSNYSHGQSSFSVMMDTRGWRLLAPPCLCHCWYHPLLWPPQNKFLPLFHFNFTPAHSTVLWILLLFEQISQIERICEIQREGYTARGRND